MVKNNGELYELHVLVQMNKETTGRIIIVGSPFGTINVNVSQSLIDYMGSSLEFDKIKMDTQHLKFLLKHILTWFESERYRKDCGGVNHTIHTHFPTSVFGWPSTKISDIEEIITLFGANYNVLN
jgi:hypothetical protein